MNIDCIKEEIQKKIRKNVTCKVNIGRNKFENFEGKIEAIYPFLFTIVNGNETKCLSYSDVITKTLELKLK